MIAFSQGGVAKIKSKQFSEFGSQTSTLDLISFIECPRYCFLWTKLEREEEVNVVGLPLITVCCPEHAGQIGFRSMSEVYTLLFHSICG